MLSIKLILNPSELLSPTKIRHIMNGLKFIIESQIQCPHCDVIPVSFVNISEYPPPASNSIYRSIPWGLLLPTFEREVLRCRGPISSTLIKHLSSKDRSILKKIHC